MGEAGAAPGDVVRRLAGGETLISAWSSFRDPAVAEQLARTDFDLVTFDMQHGAHDMASVMAGIGAVSLLGKASAARPPLAEWGTASRLLDAGARVIIAPMINCRAEAQALVAATRFPPLGERSWGPMRAMELQGLDGAAYLASANAATLVLAMIETAAAVAALDDILDVEGLDGVFVGPADLSISLARGEALDPAGDAVDRVIAEIARKAGARGKIAGIYVITPEFGRRAIDHGFRLVALGADGEFLARGARESLAELRGC